MIILRRNFGTSNIEISPDSTESNEEVCVDLSVGKSYKEAGTSESITMTVPYTLKPGGCIVVETWERVTVPKNVFGFLCSKGSLAGRGLLVPNTKIDPLFSDTLDIAIYNAGKRVLTIEKGMKFCSIVFQQLSEPINSNTPRSGPRISNERKNKMAEFISENKVLLVTSLVTVLVSTIGAAIATAITVAMQTP